MHIHAPPVVERARGIDHCPLCRSRRRFVAEFVEWYGWTVTCCGCGERWQDGERIGPSTHYKRDRIRLAKAKWDLCASGQD